MNPKNNNHEYKEYKGKKYDWKTGFPLPNPIADEKPLSPKDPSQFEIDVMLIFAELESLLLDKHKDYGPRNISEAPGGALYGLRVRLHDKLARINNLIDNNKNPQNESLEDSFADMANYAIIGLLFLRGKWSK